MGADPAKNQLELLRREADIRRQRLKVANRRIVLKNPGNGRSPKNGFVVALATLGVEPAFDEDTKLACRLQLPS
jgi:hypothetical protein